MITGIFSSFEENMDLKDKFSKIFQFEHIVEAEAVTGIIQLDEKEPVSEVDSNQILNCELIDYVQVGRNVRKKDEETGIVFFKVSTRRRGCTT